MNKAKRLSMDEIKRVLYRACMRVLGYNPDAPYTKKAPPVRVAYITHGQPDFTPDEDVLFFSITEEDSDTSQPVHETWKDEGKEYKRIHTVGRVLSVQFTAYGKNGYDHLLDIKHDFMDGAKELREAGMYLIPTGDAPKSVPEYYESMWWERCGLTLAFNNAYTYEEEVKTIEVVPVKTIAANHGGGSDKVTEGTQKAQGESGLIIRKNR